MKKTILEGAREVPVLAEVDVLVLGAGPAGVSAAICAGTRGREYDAGGAERRRGRRGDDGADEPLDGQHAWRLL